MRRSCSDSLLTASQVDGVFRSDNRYNAGSPIITSRFRSTAGELVGNPTLADAILDRIVHNAYRVELSGESLRKPRAST